VHMCKEDNGRKEVACTIQGKSGMGGGKKKKGLWAMGYKKSKNSSSGEEVRMYEKERGQMGLEKRVSSMGWQEANTRLGVYTGKRKRSSEWGEEGTCISGYKKETQEIERWGHSTNCSRETDR